jgi:hypothetical protein
LIPTISTPIQLPTTAVLNHVRPSNEYHEQEVEVNVASVGHLDWRRIIIGHPRKQCIQQYHTPIEGGNTSHQGRNVDTL